VKRTWRRFRKWLKWTLDSYRQDIEHFVRGTRQSLRELRHGIRNSIPFLRKRSHSRAASQTGSPAPGRPRSRRMKSWLVRNGRYYRFLIAGALGALRRAGKRTWRRLTFAKSARPNVPVVPPRPAEKPLKRIWRFVRHLPRNAYYSVVGLGRLTRTAITATYRGFRYWLRHGNGYTFLRGVPALLVCAAVVWALMIPYFNRTSRIVGYLERLDQAVRQGDMEEAQLCAERLVNDTRGNPFYRFAYASILAERGDHARAVATMRDLAPINSPGYGPAQLWLAQLLLTQKNPSSDALKEIETRLLLATRDESCSKAAEALLIRFYCGAGSLDRAEGHIASAGEDAAAPQLTLALAFAARGEREKAVKHATVARDYFRDICAKDPHNAEARLEWAQAVTLLGDFNGAIQILDDGYRRTGALGYRTSLGRILFGLAQYMGGHPNQFVQRVSMLARAIEYDDGNPLYIRSFLDILPLDRPNAPGLRNELDAAIALKQAPMMLQLFLAIDSSLKKNDVDAQNRFAAARSINPESARIMNNMAWTMANTKPERLSLALTLANTAVAQMPEQLRFLDTRGQILAKLERWEEAMNDLKRAATVLPDNQDLKEVMARVSTHLKEPQNEPERVESSRK
jgi:predicted Zn-dependent protease